MDCKNQALCLFDEPPVQTDIKRNFYTEHYPKTSIIPGAPIEFEISKNHNEYINLANCRLNLKIKIAKTDKTAWDASADKVAFENLPMASLFEDVFCYLSGTQIQGGQHMYPYTAYLSTLLNYHPAAKMSHLRNWGWYEDEPKGFDSVANKGFKSRKALTDGGKSWYISGPLFLDMTRQGRYLLPQVDVGFKLLRAKSSFALESHSGEKYEYIIENCMLEVNRIEVLDTVISGHNKGMMKYNAIYPLKHIDPITYTVTKGKLFDNRDSLFTTQIPKFLCIGLVEHDAFNGTIEKNPFNFQHFNLREIGIYEDGEITPGRIMTVDYKNDDFARAYNQTMNALKYYNTDDSCGITMTHFGNGYNLYAFDLTADGNCDADHRNITKSGSITIKLKFTTALTEAINVILYPIFDAKLEITKLRDVIMSYSR